MLMGLDGGRVQVATFHLFFNAVGSNPSRDSESFYVRKLYSYLMKGY
jgi:hypothetical protein